MEMVNVEVPVDSVWNARPMDVHRWSDHPEVNFFVDLLWLEFETTNRIDAKSTRGKQPKQPKKNQFKALLLDLYVCWSEDPLKYIGVHLSPNKWVPSSRYNALHLSKNIIGVLNWLVVAEYVIKKNHRYSSTSPSGNHTSRFKASARLIQLFEKAKFGCDDIGVAKDKEVIILKGAIGSDSEIDDDELVVPIEYEDTSEVTSMRNSLRKYNDFLRLTHIDLATAEQPFVYRKVRKGKRRNQTITLPIGRSNNEVRRIFSRGSWECHGRFYGGWWQQLNKEERKSIFINGNPTVEVDFKAMHPSLLFIQLGLPIPSDPYRLGVKIFDDADMDVQRKWIKQLVLCAINAKDRSSACAAFRSESPKGSSQKRLTNAKLGILLDAFIEQHPQLEKFICKDQGIRLMRKDSDITALIIDHLTSKGIPVLTIHDSYIVQRHHFSELRIAMELAAIRTIRRSLYATQEGLEVDPSLGWGGIVNESAVNKLPRIQQTKSYRARLKEYCIRNMLEPIKSISGRGLGARPVTVLKKQQKKITS